jgi:hypothetical protein
VEAMIFLTLNLKWMHWKQLNGKRDDKDEFCISNRKPYEHKTFYQRSFHLRQQLVFQSAVRVLYVNELAAWQHPSLKMGIQAAGVIPHH